MEQRAASRCWRASRLVAVVFRSLSIANQIVYRRTIEHQRGASGVFSRDVESQHARPETRLSSLSTRLRTESKFALSLSLPLSRSFSLGLSGRALSIEPRISISRRNRVSARTFESPVSPKPDPTRRDQSRGNPTLSRTRGRLDRAVKSVHFSSRRSKETFELQCKAMRNRRKVRNSTGLHLEPNLVNSICIPAC